MRKSLTRRPSPALVVSIVALVVAMGGTAYAGFSVPKNSVGTKQLKSGAVTTGKIKNGAVTESKINTSGLTVPNALFAKNAGTAGSATSATTATNAGNASDLGGVPASGYATVAQPAFTDASLDSGYANYGEGYADVAYEKDTLGFVHLIGEATCPTGENDAFTLPAADAPAEAEELVSGDDSDGASAVYVFPSGLVQTWTTSTYCSFDGVTFPAAGVAGTTASARAGVAHAIPGQ
jgi:hypothetical protein